VTDADDDSEVVIRFQSFLEAKLVENAEDTYDEELENSSPDPRYGLSVIAVAPLQGETVDETVLRLLGTSTLSGKHIAVLKGSFLRAAGFLLVPDPNDKEPDHHLIGEPGFVPLARASELETMFENHRRKNPMFPKGKRS
jgi:hypothetical protein